MENLQVNHDVVMLQTLFTETIYKVDGWKDESVEGAIQQDDNQPTSVVSEPQPEVYTPTAQSSGFDYIGENNRYVLVLVNYHGIKHIPENDKAFFLKIIGALKMNLDDVAVVNYAHYNSAGLKAFKEYFSCSKIIAFGLSPQAEVFKNLNILDYSTTSYDGVSIMRTPDILSAIEADTNRKMKLWNALKLLFNVK